MNGLAYTLDLSSSGGWSRTTIAAFREFADLMLFWTAWAEDIENADVKREARFVHHGRSVRVVRPEDAADIMPGATA